MSTPDLFTVADIPIWPVEQCDVRHWIDATYNEVKVYTLTADRQAWAPPQYWVYRGDRVIIDVPGRVFPMKKEFDSLYSLIS